MLSIIRYFYLLPLNKPIVYFVIFFNTIKHADLLLIFWPDNEAISGRIGYLPDSNNINTAVCEC